MHKIILFRGGMFGDIILSMLDKAYVQSVYPLRQVRERFVMKKFYDFSMEEKKSYLSKMDGYTLSHDTDFCKQVDEDHVIQIFCSDKKMLPHIAERFWTQNDYHQVEHVKTDLKLSEQYDLADDIHGWQEHHVFKHRLDTATIYSQQFPAYLDHMLGVKDLDWARTIHELWLETESRSLPLH